MEIKKAVIYGAGSIGKYMAHFFERFSIIKIDVVGITDTYKKALNFKCAIPFINIERLKDIQFDLFIIATENAEYVSDIKKHIKRRFRNKEIINYREAILIVRKERIINKYRNSKDPDMLETVQWLNEHPLTVRNQYANRESVKYKIYSDSNSGYPYVMYFQKKMFLPKEYAEKDYVENIVENDQYPGSPHLYLTDGHDLRKGDILVDAGTCEGNFALRYIDVLKKAYLVEPNPKWQIPLKLSFSPYKEKVVLVFKKLSDINSDDCVTLDTLIPDEKINFIKMDIEGAETVALLGGIDLISRCHPKLSVCCYHRQFDEKYINFILNSFGYKVHHSNGYLFMNPDPDIDKSLDFRRGIIYGDW